MLRIPSLSEMFPKTVKTFLDLPLPEPPKADARPSLTELIESDRAARAGQGS